MALKRNVSLLQGLKYRGGGPMLAWMLHRVSGLGIVLFVGTHILSSYLGGEIGKSLNTLYESWGFQIFVFFCVLYHAINGLRIVLLDFFPAWLEHQREAIWIQWFVFIPIYGIAVLVIITKGLSG